MKRIISGKKIEIDNNVAKFMELAYQGRLLDSRLDNGNAIGLNSGNVGKLQSVRDLYFKTIKLLYSPFKDIEINAKYDMILCKMKQSDESIKGYVENGYLEVEIGPGLILRFKKSNWIIINKQIPADYEHSLEKYAEQFYYDYIEWALGEISDGRTTEDFFKVYVEKLYRICGKNNEVTTSLAFSLYRRVAFEIGSLYVPSYSIRDLLKDREYLINIYDNGVISTGDGAKRYIIDNGNVKTIEKNIVIKDYQVFERKVTDEYIGPYKPNENTPKWLDDIISYILYNYVKENEMPMFKGYYYLNNVIMEINGDLYIVQAEDNKESLLGDNSKILSISEELAIYERRKEIRGGIVMVETYKYNLENNDNELIGIRYIGGV